MKETEGNKIPKRDEQNIKFTYKRYPFYCVPCDGKQTGSPLDQ